MPLARTVWPLMVPSYTRCWISTSSSHPSPLLPTTPQSTPAHLWWRARGKPTHTDTAHVPADMKWLNICTISEKSFDPRLLCSEKKKIFWNDDAKLPFFFFLMGIRTYAPPCCVSTGLNANCSDNPHYGAPVSLAWCKSTIDFSVLHCETLCPPSHHKQRADEAV